VMARQNFLTSWTPKRHLIGWSAAHVTRALY